MSDTIGSCDGCHGEFRYFLVHNGFNDSSYAYCSDCGLLATLSHWSDRYPAGIKSEYGLISEEMAETLEKCECGGSFTRMAIPRCPKCKHELSAESATEWIERNAPGTKKGWRWQRNWQGLYSIMINGRFVKDNWTVK